MDFAMNNKEWSLVIQRVSKSSVDIWVGKLLAQKKPELVQIDIFCGDELIATHSIDQWQRPFRRLSQGFYHLHQCTGLQAGTHYRVELRAQTGARKLLQQGRFNTLPAAIPALGQKPFTIALGSCFANQDDDGRVSAAYAALYDKADDSVRPDITFLVGDQVYLDLGFASMIPFSQFIRRRFARRYAANWRDLSGVFTRGATWMLPDDHDYWNDFPFNDLPILALQSLKIPAVKAKWTDAANDGVFNIQSSRLLEMIEIGDDLSICLANIRTGRTDEGFMAQADFAQLLVWARSLRTPGVLVVQQLLLDEAVGEERNLPSFAHQYQALVDALSASGNDILVLSGDVHFGRIASVDLAGGGKLTEVVSSPLANLKGLFNGLGAGVATSLPEHFPLRLAQEKPGRSPKVDYHSQYVLGHTPGRYFTPYPKDRTNEHFMTISLSRVGDKVLELSIEAWLVRVWDDQKALPRRGFIAPYTMRLRGR
jgi:hypothetical protein